MIASRLVSIAFVIAAVFLGGCAAQQGGFNAQYQTRHGGIAFGGSGSNVIRTTGFSQSAPIAILSSGNGYVVNNLDGNACPGGYRHNGNGWTCPGGQVQMGQYVLRQNQYLLVPQNTSSGSYTPGSCQVGGKDFGDISEGSCLEIRKALGRSAPSETRRVVTQEAYCKDVNRTNNKTGEVQRKNVLNPERTQAYCDNLKVRLRNGSIRWEDLQTVSVN